MSRSSERPYQPVSTLETEMGQLMTDRHDNDAQVLRHQEHVQQKAEHVVTRHMHASELLHAATAVAVTGSPADSTVVVTVTPSTHVALDASPSSLAKNKNVVTFSLSTGQLNAVDNAKVQHQLFYTIDSQIIITIIRLPNPWKCLCMSIISLYPLF